MDNIVIELEDGKYVYTFSDKTGAQTVTRNGEVWSNETGNNFLLAMAMKIEELEAKVDDCVYVIEEVVSKNPTSCDSRLVSFLEENKQ